MRLIIDYIERFNFNFILNWFRRMFYNKILFGILKFKLGYTYLLSKLNLVCGLTIFIWELNNFGLLNMEYL